MFPVGIVRRDRPGQERIIALEHALDVWVRLETKLLRRGQRELFGRLDNRLIDQSG